MKVIKPDQLVLLTRVFENQGRAFLVVSTMALFPFSAPRKLMMEAAFWKFVATAIGKEVLDPGMFKVKGEVLVTGSCYAPDGIAVPATYVRLQVGSIDKRLAVIGDRHWDWTGLPSKPEPFTKMRVSWDNAFGGEGFAPNPFGKGAVQLKGEKESIHPLPNIEDLKNPVGSRKDRPMPAGLGPMDFSWPQRLSKAGTYDSDWFRDLYPGFAGDMDLTIFNAACDDQQLQGYFQGDESFTLENMHAAHKTLQGRLPAINARSLVWLKANDATTIHDVRMKLDTVWLFPDAERGIVIYRGMIPIIEDDGADVDQVLIASEDMENPKPIEHYERVIALRKDPNVGDLHAMRDADLLHSIPAVTDIKLRPEEQPDIEEWLKREGLMEKHARARYDRDMAQVAERVKAEGMDPAVFWAAMPPEESVPDPNNPEEFGKWISKQEEKLKETEKLLDEMPGKQEAEARAMCKDMGVDYDELMGTVPEGGGPPTFSAALHIQSLKDSQLLAKNAGTTMPHIDEMLSDPDLEDKLTEHENKLKACYRNFAHVMPAAKSRLPKEALDLREQLLSAIHEGRSLGDVDFTGADLSNLVLDGANLERVFLEKANLTGCSLKGANLNEAVLARATLKGVVLTGARLAKANLGLADLAGAHMQGVDLTEAVLLDVNLTGANLQGAKLAGANLSSANLKGTDLSGADLSDSSFSHAELSSTRMVGANLRKSAFIESDLSGCDFSEADLTRAGFIKSKGTGAAFRKSCLHKCTFVLGTEFPGSDFSEANMTRCCLRGANLKGSNLSGADLSGSDLSEANLSDAKLYRVVAIESLMMRTDLTGADLTSANIAMGILQKAKIQSSNFLGSNLFRADLSRVVPDTQTSFKDANMTQARAIMRKPNG